MQRLGPSDEIDTSVYQKPSIYTFLLKKKVGRQVKLLENYSIGLRFFYRDIGVSRP